MQYKIALALALLVLLLSAWNAPMSGDEYVHVQQAEKVIAYFSTLGQDKSALDTPISRLKHYGQSFDTFTVAIVRLLSIDDLYRFRHLCNALMAWLVILYISRLTNLVTHSRLAAVLSILLVLATGRFMGHAMNNLKDIPFAFAYIFSLYHLSRFLLLWPLISRKHLALLTLGIGFAVSIRIGGLVIFALFMLFSGLYMYYLVVSRKQNLEELYKHVGKFMLLATGVLLLACLIGFLVWPWAWENLLLNPWKSLALMHDYPTTVRQIFEGKLYWSDQFPWYYLFKYLLITLPVAVLLGLALLFFFIKKVKHAEAIILLIFIFIAFGFPLFYASTTGANVYGGWRQLLFVFPPLVVLSATGLFVAFESFKKRKKTRHISILIFSGLLVFPFYFQLVNYPYQYTFFNPLTGGTHGAYGNYELDYYFTSFKKAYAYIDANHPEAKIVAANFIIPEYYRGKGYEPLLIDYYQRSSSDWDYAIICNTFLVPHTLKAGLWPPSATVFSQEVAGVPILAVVRRHSKLDWEGAQNLEAGQYDLAIEKLEKARSLDRNNESILLNLAKAYHANAQNDQAKNMLDRLLYVYPDNEAAWDLQGEMMMEAGKWAEAKKMFDKVIGLNYKYYHAYINLAKAYLAAGERDAAVATVVACLQINPFYAPARQLYGRLLIERGEVELGKKMLDFSNKGTSKYGNQ